MPRHHQANLPAIAFSLPALFGLVASPSAHAQTTVIPSATTSPQTAVSKPITTQIAEALGANPVTAPYVITVEARKGQIALKGRVGSKVVHDAAVRTAIAFGVPVADDLVIDTFAAAAAVPQVPNVGLPLVTSSYTYPPPLFGRFDQPFFGMEPPLATFPPWWGEMSRYRLGLNRPGAGAPGQAGNAPTIAPNTVEMTIDPVGVAVIRGTVPSETDKANIAAHLLQMQGVSKIINQLTVDPTLPQGNAPPPSNASNDEPPPPPQPVIAVPRADAAASAPALPVPPKPNAAPLRVDRAIAAKPELVGSPIKVQVRDGIATISGSVPTVYEAMLAYRAAERTPGVNQVVDSLQFVVPDGTTPNPLIDKGRPDDVEPYLLAQIRRQVGDAAHLDRVRIAGNQLEVKGVLASADDRGRVEAILRSMPILRGFTLLPELGVTDR